MEGSGGCSGTEGRNGLVRVGQMEAELVAQLEEVSRLLNIS